LTGVFAWLLTLVGMLLLLAAVVGALSLFAGVVLNLAGRIIPLRGARLRRNNRGMHPDAGGTDLDSIPRDIVEAGQARGDPVRPRRQLFQLVAAIARTLGRPLIGAALSGDRGTERVSQRPTVSAPTPGRSRPPHPQRRDSRRGN